jgi:hypothetical protein
MFNRYLHSALLCLTLSACAGALKYELRGSQLSPGSDAHVAAKVDVARNMTSLDIKAANLTPVDRIVEAGTAYLVWMRRDDQVPWTRLGALELKDEGRSGSAQLTVSEIAFDLQISAEPNATAASPSGKTVFEQRVEDK